MLLRSATSARSLGTWQPTAGTRTRPEQHMRQLLGTEPLQAILGAISKKEEDDKHHYIRMIDSMDPIAALQPEQQEKEGEDTNGEVSLLQKAREIAAAIQQWKQQSRQQQQQRTTND